MRLAYAVSRDWLYAVSSDKLFKYSVFIFMQYMRLAYAVSRDWLMLCLQINYLNIQ